jgi:serine-type D-Ala-D-Ala carboxypeptidase/endopeptidase (penicillin-binding protein 4)
VSLREKRHPRSRRAGRWLPVALVATFLLLAGGAVTYDLSGQLFGDRTVTPAQVPPPEGLNLVPSGTAPPVATTSVLAATGGRLDPSLVAAAVSPYVGGLGPHATVVVSDLVTGEVAYAHGAKAVVPASTMKLLTTAAALEALGSMTRFSTTVLRDGDRLVLVGGGDPFLMSSRAKSRGLYPARGDLDTLAARTAAVLTSQGERSVRLGYDASRFSGPAVNPTWPASYLTDDVVPPISALWVDEAQGADGRYVADPARTAGRVFAAALGRHGITVTGPVVPGSGGPQATEVAKVASAPVGQIVQRTLAVSDNNAAEVLGHQVGLAVVQDGSFAGGVAGVQKVLTGLGVSLLGTEIHDGSGLSRDNRLTPGSLLGVLGLGGSAAHPGLREVLTGLPVAGFSGSLQLRFEKGPVEAKGRVRAKTGTLTGVSGLAGVATDLNDNRMAFVAIANGFDPATTLAVHGMLDRIAGALGACRCNG